MTKRKNIKAFTSLWREIFSTRKVVKTKDIQWWLRAALVTSRRQLQGGFVLPTTVMVILVVVLVVTTLVFRSFNRTTQIIGERQQQVIYNAATPAIDRAKSKLEFLFTRDNNLPAGIPSDSILERLLGRPEPTPLIPNPTDATYTIQGAEERLNFGNDPINRNAAGWFFRERDNQGRERIVAYSINFKKQAIDQGRPNDATDDRVVARLQDNLATKARNSVVRNGPVNAINSGDNQCGAEAIRLTANERDWEPISSTNLAKTFQVTAVAIDNPGRPNQTLTTLEFQQDRQAERGNKWGAYSRNDLELFNAPPFRWNGAIRSEGNIFLGSFGDFRAHLISAPASCTNNSANDSRISMAERRNSRGEITFQGQIVSGRLNLQQFQGNSDIHLFTAVGANPDTSGRLNPAADSVAATVANPDVLALDPVALFTRDAFEARGAGSRTNVANRDGAWERSKLKRRIFNEGITPPNLDDTFRADNRYGPAPTYDGRSWDESRIKIPAGRRVGEQITAADPNLDPLTRNISADPRNPEDLGLDGYWERRAVRGGLRVVVGQRLELAGVLPRPVGAINPVAGREHEFLQRRAQHNNLAAVQATAVYHYQNGAGANAGLAPVACVATTVHPGTAQTLKNSATFDRISISGTPTVITDFLNGRGTNGLEFESPIGTAGPTVDMLTALNNLTRASGDPNGAFPPVQPAIGSPVSPNPNLTPYGDFSNLRRALGLGGYATLSIADRSYIDTAACSLGMLAYHVHNLETYNPSAAELATLSTALAALAPVPPPYNGAPPSPPEAYIERLTGRDQQIARLLATREQVRYSRRVEPGTPPTPAIVTPRYTCAFSAAPLNRLCPFDVAAPTRPSPKYGALYFSLPATTHTTGGVAYTAVNPAAIRIAPRLPGVGSLIPQRDVTGLVATVPGSPNSLPNSNVTGLNNLIKLNPIGGGPAAQHFQVAFKDAGMFNGREMMSKRVLDIDLNLLRTTAAPGGDFWLPLNPGAPGDQNAPPPAAVVYAFREDAVREDGISRPPSPAVPGLPVANQNDMSTMMDARPNSLADPRIDHFSPLGISVKPVDYLPDPDRRPNGFRLKNGSRLDRGNSPAGMSFISDNAVYIYGDFNLHSTDGTRTNLLEEFTERLRDDWGNFYTRRTRDGRFANPGTDTWRPTEVLGDSVTVLSGNFCDGSIEDGIIYPNLNPAPALGFNIQTMYGCNANASFTSYLNQNRPTTPLINLPVAPAANNNAWSRENPYDPTSPIKISRAGKPMYITAAGVEEPYELRTPGFGGEAQTYLRFEDDDPRCGVLGGQRKCIGRASETIVNSMIIQGTIPSRAGQSAGGFHNFPRLIENWDSIPLSMTGSFRQMKFSTQATGPYDQDSWERAMLPISTGGRHEQLFYYDPPDRRWGYDVALQYQTPSPVARRASVPNPQRNETYKEIPVDDPYAQRLLCVIPGINRPANCP
jgi:hypothetical protein